MRLRQSIDTVINAQRFFHHGFHAYTTQAEVSGCLAPNSPYAYLAKFLQPQQPNNQGQ